jgi:hypothetical protein
MLILLDNNIEVIIILIILIIKLGLLILKDFILNVISVNDKQRRFVKIVKKINIYIGLIIYSVII